jgi:hypothetical protein
VRALWVRDRVGQGEAPIRFSSAIGKVLEMVSYS